MCALRTVVHDLDLATDLPDARCDRPWCDVRGSKTHAVVLDVDPDGRGFRADRYSCRASAGMAADVPETLASDSEDMLDELDRSFDLRRDPEMGRAIPVRRRRGVLDARKRARVEP